LSGRLGHANAATTLGMCAHFMALSDRDSAATVRALVAPHTVKSRTNTASD
jgi:hypothetical protein